MSLCYHTYYVYLRFYVSMFVVITCHISSVSPYLKQMCMVSASKLMHLLEVCFNFNFYKSFDVLVTA